MRPRYGRPPAPYSARIPRGRFVPLLLLGIVLHILAHYGVGAVTRTLYRLDGAATFHQMSSVAEGRDINGDGFPDFLLGAPSANGDVGVVEIRSGYDSSLLQTTAGTAAGQFGSSPVWGHFDSDGIIDFACGLPSASKAQVRLGPTFSNSLTFNGSANTLLGTAVDNAGKLLGNDLLDDLIIGASSDDTNGTNAGRVVVWSPSTGQNVHLLGEASGDLFGASLASIGDLNGDGKPEFAVGAPERNNGLTEDTGAVYIYNGSTLARMALIFGPAAGDRLGAQVSALGDVNGDSVPDFAASAPYAFGAGGNDAGIILVYDGASAASGAGIVLRRLEGAAVLGNHQTFGLSLARAGDVNGDGIQDLLVGCPIDDPQARTHAGSAFAYSGANGALLERFEGETPGQNLGADVASAGDVNRDGRADLLIGSPNASPQGKSNAGSVYVQLVPGPAPVISNIRIENVTLTGARIRWATSLFADSRVDYGTTATYGQFATEDNFKQEHVMDLSGLSPDTIYHFKLTSSTKSTTGTTATGDLTFSTLPIAPSGLAVSANGDRTLRLTWTDQSQTETGFKVFRKTGQANFAELLPSPRAGAATGTGSTVTVDDANLQPNTQYFYLVRATHSGGHSADSSQASGLTLPGASGTVTLSSLTTTSLTVSWTDPNPTPPTTWEIERRVDSGNFEAVETVPGATLSRVYSGLTPNTSYTFRVRGVNASGPSVNWTSSAATRTLPLAPGNPVATPTGATTIQVTWTAPLPGTVDGYRIQRRQGMGAFGSPVQVGANAISYADNGLQPNTTYTYQIVAFNASGESAPATTGAALTYPGPVTNVTVTLPSATSIQVTWTAPLPGTPDGYRVRRRTGGGAFESPVQLPASPTSYLDSGLQPNISYTYQITAFNASGESTPVTSQATPTVPAAPTNPVATPTGPDTIQVTWTTPLPGTPDGYRIRRRQGMGAFGAPVQVSPSPTSYTDTGLQPNSSYSYQITAFNASGESAPATSGAALTFPAAPTNVTAAAAGTDTIELTWTAPLPGTPDGYRIQRRQGMGSFGSPVQVGPSPTAYTDSGLQPNTSYTYQIRAFNASGESAAATSNTERTHPLAPQNVAILATAPDSLRVSWTDPNTTAAASYRLERRQGDGPWEPLMGTVQSPHTDSGLARNTIYSYRVTGSNGTSSSVPSSVASGVTGPVLTAAANSATEIALSWSPSNPGIQSYRIERRTANTGFVELLQVPGSQLTYTDSSLTPKTTYFFRVQPIVTGIPTAASAPSNEASTVTRPTAPTLTATAQSSTVIRLDWTSANPGVQLYRIFRRGANNVFSPVGEVNGSVQTYLDSGLTSNTEHFYRVRAVNSGGESVDSNTASEWTRPASGGKIVVTPLKLNFGTVRRNLAPVKKIKISNTDRLTALEGRISIAGDGVSLRSGGGSFRILPRGLARTVEVQFTPGDQARAWSGTVTILSGDSRKPIIVIPITARSR